jgi:hypothetical protein
MMARARSALAAARLFRLVLPSLLCSGGCGAGLAPAFDPRFADSDPAQVRAVALRLQAQTRLASDAHASLVASTHGPHPQVLLHDLSAGRVRWSVALAAQSRPERLGDLVVTTSQGRFIALSASDGRKRFETPLEGCAYLGAARDAQRIAVTCEQPPERGSLSPRGRVFALDASSGALLWERSANGALGRPAARSGLVLLPWQRQAVSVLDAESGVELARLRSRDDVIDWVRADARGVFFGHRRIYRLGAQGYAGAREQASDISLDSEALPGQPTPFESAFAARPGKRSARGRIALHFQPEASGATGAAIAFGRYYFVFYRYVFAYDAAGALQWSRVLDSDAIAGQALQDGLLIALESGQVLQLSAAGGEPLRRSEIGSELAAASLDGAGLPPVAADPSVRRDLRQDLSAIALDTDTRLVPARSHAVALLAQEQDPLATRDLLLVYEHAAAPAELKRAAADAIRTRRVGLEHLIAALRLRYDFLEQSHPAPLSVIVPALIDARDARAVPGLLERLNDGETPSAALPVLIRGIGQLGDESVVDSLFAWLRLYRADSSFAADSEALLEAARVIAMRGGQRGRSLLQALRGAGGVQSPQLLAEIDTLLRPPPSDTAAPEAPPALVAEPAPQLPEKLSREALQATFAQHESELRVCIDEELARNPQLASVRVAMIIESDGGSHGLTFAPNHSALADCLYPKLVSYRFPPFRSGRQVASYVIAARPAAAAASDTSAERARRAPWWRWHKARRRRPAVTVMRDPWWRSRQPLAPLIERVADATPRQDTAPPPAPQPAAATAPAPPQRAAPAQTATPAQDGTGRREPAAESPPPQDAWWIPSSPVPAAPRE